MPEKNTNLLSLKAPFKDYKLQNAFQENCTACQVNQNQIFLNKEWIKLMHETGKMKLIIAMFVRVPHS